jgi:hypothetical protein
MCHNNKWALLVHLHPCVVSKGQDSGGVKLNLTISTHACPCLLFRTESFEATKLYITSWKEVLKLMIHRWTSRVVVDHNTDNQSMQFLYKQWHVFLEETLDTWARSVSLLHTLFTCLPSITMTLYGEKKFELCRFCISSGSKENRKAPVVAVEVHSSYLCFSALLDQTAVEVHSSYLCFSALLDQTFIHT